jgi:DASH complex subunit ASK1
MASIHAPSGKLPKFELPSFSPQLCYGLTLRQFWKQFFEASANVSLSGYEELAGGEDSAEITAEEETTVHDETADDYTPRPRSAGTHDVSVATDQSSVIYHGHGQQHEESVLSDRDGDLTGSTPRPPATKTLPFRPNFANLHSPYEALRREYNNKSGGTGSTSGPQRGTAASGEDEEDTELLFQQHTSRLPDVSLTPRSSLGPGDLANDGGGKEGLEQDKNKDPLLHRLLDKNYRIAATPLKGTAGISPIKWKIEKVATPGKGKDKQKDRPIWEDSPTSSPEMAVPQLRSAAFMSPMRAAYKGKAAAAARAPRTPGVSVQTPATGRKTKDVFAAERTGGKNYEDEITWESDSDGGLGEMSPPKTIKFALPPSKLLQTPGMFIPCR